MNDVDRIDKINKKRYAWVVISALVQGFLLGIYAVIKSGALLCMPLTIIFLVPFVFWLSQEHWGRRLANLLIGLTIILLAFWIYRLWSLYSPNGSFRIVPSQKSDLIRVSMAVFLLIPFFQCRIASWSWKFPYSEIFFQFCRNLFLLFQASIVIAVFWGLLITAGLLFDIVGLEKVPYFIFTPITAVPLSSLIIAISISVAIKHPGIDSLGRWILSVLAWLLPFFSVLSVVFLLCLPLSGLQKLWSTGQASTLMLLLQFGTIILANAAYTDGLRSAFTSTNINLLSSLSLLCLPIYTALCIWSVSLRITQYGLTVDRVQAMFLAIITGIWGLGYAGAVVLRKWPKSIGNVNMVCVAFMAVIVALMNSPILDPYRLAALNQAERLYTGQTPSTEFDYLYLRFGLGRYGNRILSALSENGSESVKAGVASAMSITPEEYLRYTTQGIPPLSMRHRIIHSAKVYPEGSKLTSEQEEYFVSHWENCVREADDVAFVFADVQAGAHNLIVFTEYSARVFTLKPELIGTIAGEFVLSSLDVRTVEPQYMDIEVGGNVYRVE